MGAIIILLLLCSSQRRLKELKEKGKITSLAEDYVDSPETAPKTEVCIRKLS